MAIYDTISLNIVMNVIEAIGLKKSFKMGRPLSGFWRRKGDIEVLEDVTFKVMSGEIVCILGPNGAGKTTLLKILATSILPTSGEAYVNGYSILDNADLVRNSIGVTEGDSRSFYWRLSGIQNLEFFGCLYGLSKKDIKKKVEELVTLLRIKYPEKKVGLYSAGNRQRLAIARALLNDPKVLLLDEVFKDLDPVTIEEIKMFLKSSFLRESGRAILLATHSLNHIIGFCNKAMIIKEGRVAVTLREISDNIMYIYKKYV